jgi:predicted DCC family thiol-disulfide oxidoreductase YuxK
MSPPPGGSDFVTILYDGDCAFCRRTMRFAKRRDPRHRLRFVALQSPAGQTLLAQHALPLDEYDSLVLIEAGTVHLRSSAILRICRQLSGAWPILRVGIVLPRRFRDWLYTAVARRRNG